MTNQVFESAFRRILKKPCWDVRLGHGSFLTLEFGRPSLTIREPIAAKSGSSNKVREHLARRQVYVHGEWHLWLMHCNWEVRANGKFVGNSSKRLSARHAADFLNGQKLIKFSILPRKVRCLFTFDLGASLSTTPYDRHSEQWSLFEPSGKVLALRADFKYCYGRAVSPREEASWKRS
jgi:hypothetical protein